MAVVGAFAVAAATVPLSGAIGQAPAPEYPIEEIHAPTPVPDRTVLTPTEDLSTSQAVSWRTDETVNTAQAQIALATDNSGFKADSETIIAETGEPMVADLGYPTLNHTVTFGDLTPDTKYLYRVGDGANWTEWYEFETATGGTDPFSFVYFGDAQNDVQEHWSRVIRRAFSDRPEADLIVSAGDLINQHDDDDEWGEWFGAGGWINGMVNQIPTPGNHEYSGQAGLSPQWNEQFNLPDNGPQGDTPIHEALGGTVYYTDYQGVRFISLNSNLNAVPSGQSQASLDMQAEWLDGVLEENPHKWSVVTFHHPIWSAAPGRNNPQVRDTWLPVLEEHDVDLVLQGHDHNYTRGNIAEGTAVRDGHGTVYVVSVSGPKMYDLSDEVWTGNGGELKSTRTQTQMYQLIDVTKDEITYEARTATGEYHDGFTIRERDNGRKLVIEDPQNRRNDR